MMIGLAAALLVFTGIWHMTEWLMGGRDKDSLRLIPIGGIYLIFGYLIAFGYAGLITLVAALGVTCIGVCAAVLTRKSSQIRVWVTWAFILMDAMIIVGVAIGLLAAI